MPSRRAVIGGGALSLLGGGDLNQLWQLPVGAATEQVVMHNKGETAAGIPSCVFTMRHNAPSGSTTSHGKLAASRHSTCASSI